MSNFLKTYNILNKSILLTKRAQNHYTVNIITLSEHFIKKHSIKATMICLTIYM